MREANPRPPEASVARSRGLGTMAGVLLAAFAAACGAPSHASESPSASSTTAAATGSSTAPAPVPLPRVPEHDSSNAVRLVAKAKTIVDLRDVIGALAPRELGEAFTTITSSPSASAMDPNLLPTLGIDPDGVLTIEAYELDAAASAFESHVAGFVADQPEEALGQSLLDEYRSGSHGWFMSRMHLPKKGALGDTVARGLQRIGAKPVETRLESGRAYTMGRGVWFVREDERSIDVMLALGDATANDSDAPRAVAALLAWKATPADAAGPDAVLTVRPGAARAAAFCFETQQLLAEATTKVPGEAVARSTGRAFHDALSVLDLDAPGGEDRYESVTLASRAPRGLELHAVLSKKAPPFDKSMWTTDGSDVAFPGADLVFSVNGALLYGWPLISARPGTNPYRARDIERALDAGGPLVLAQMLGDFGPFVAREGMEDAEAVGQATLPFMRRFERLGFAFEPPPGERRAEMVFFGLLAANATEEQAACAVAKEETGCARGDRLTPGKPLERSGYSVVRKKIKNRWVVLASRVGGLLDKAPVDVTTGTRSAALLRFDPPTLAKDLGVDRAGGRGQYLSGWPVYRIDANVDDDLRGYRATLAPNP